MPPGYRRQGCAAVARAGSITRTSRWDSATPRPAGPAASRDERARRTGGWARADRTGAPEEDRVALGEQVDALGRDDLDVVGALEGRRLYAGIHRHLQSRRAALGAGVGALPEPRDCLAVPGEREPLPHSPLGSLPVRHRGSLPTTTRTTCSSSSSPASRTGACTAAPGRCRSRARSKSRPSRPTSSARRSRSASSPTATCSTCRAATSTRR